MKQEEKDLLLKDLCARLPYGVKLQKTYDTSDPVELYLVDLGHDIIKFYTYKGEVLTMCDVGNIERFGKLRYKPYLFPLSSMTEEQHNEFFAYFHDVEMKEIETSGDYLKAAYLGENAKHDWLNKNHFDYHYLIPKGLAIDATGLNIY
jgi:hypothetical protein